MNAIGNPVVRAILRSPLHFLLSRWVILITVRGRKTGHSYTTPVQYVRRDGAVYVVSRQGRTWWRNLRGGSTVKLRLRGADRSGKGEVLNGAALGGALPDVRGTWIEKAMRRRDDLVLVRVGLD